MLFVILLIEVLSLNSYFVLAIYSIKDLENLCGIKAHTIRIWETRYGIIKPQRTKTNIRYYQEEDLKHLLNIAFLNKNGTKISKIAKMSVEEIGKRVAEMSPVKLGNDTQMDALTLSMIEMDEFKFDRIISTNIQQIGFERAMLEVIYPFLDKLSLLWLTGSIYPVQENFISCLIRQKIIAAIDSIPPTPSKRISNKRFVTYLPEGENQELSLLLIHYLIKSRKNEVIYLGPKISIQDVKDACKVYEPDFIFTMVTETFTKTPVQTYLKTLSESFPNSQILISGYQVVVQQVKSSDNITVVSSINDMIHFLNAMNNISPSKLIG